MAAYLVRLILCSVILYSYYHFFLRNARLHQYNRIYLLITVVLSICLPLFHFTLFFQNEVTNYLVRSVHKMDQLSVVLPEIIITNRQQEHFAGNVWKEILYGAIVLFLFIRMVRSCNKVIQIKKGREAKIINGIHLFETDHPHTPFSFFNWLFWNPGVGLNTKEGRFLFAHEAYHIRQKHSWDLLFMELMIALVWINPVFYFIRKELKAIHEFLADQYATKQHNKQEYARLLILHTMRTGHYHQLITPFFNNQLKRRITMLTENKKPAFQYLRKIMVLPLIAVAFLLFSFSHLEKPLTDLVLKSIPHPGSNFSQLNTAAPKGIPAGIKTDETTVIAAVKNTSQKEQLKTATSNNDPHPELKIRIMTPDQLNLPAVPVVPVKDTVPPVKNEEEIFTKMEVPPKYNGDWVAFLVSNLDAKAGQQQGAPPGNYQALVQFIVDREGTMSNVKLLKDPGYGMGAEAMRVVKASGKWIPAKQNGRIVKAYAKQPITFQITDK